ncbi:hypothetical protein GCM10023093_22580 [Nemorincola caseinilytica]|uniref:SPOR domain-containing protein n=2 Tax=Nemorincola caseinilytica TaxID=2054315 RepID=A0ABP8NHN3_9BACT
MAQGDDPGDVAIHSDARLAVLVRKNHSYVRLSTPEPPPKAPDPAAKLTTTPNTPPPSSTALIHHDTRVVYNGKGYRVQIYSGPDRNKAIAVKSEFMRRNPGVSTYLFYVAPAFRVKVGDYRTQRDAEGMLREANSLFSPCMIVPDMVTISTY